MADRSQYYKEYRESHREAIRKAGVEYQAVHREQRRIQHGQYNAAHREELSALQAVYRIEHKEQIAVYDASHKEQKSVRGKEYWVVNREELCRTHREHYAAHPADRCAAVTGYRKAHPDKVLLWSEKHRLLKYDNTPINEFLTEIQWHDILDLHHHRCAYCGVKLGYSKGDKHPTMDHVIPLSRGGKHSKDNVVPACTHCNCSKNAKTPEEWTGLRI